MEMAVWILFCFFASIGLVQCGLWLRDAFVRRPCERPGCRVVPLYDDADRLEQRMRDAISPVWQSMGERVLLVDMGLGEECTKICDRLMCDAGGVYICELPELGEAVQRLDNLQNAADDVK